MKKVTGISFVRTAEGLRVAYAYSEIDEEGHVTASNQRGSYVNRDEQTETFVAALETSIAARLEKE